MDAWMEGQVKENGDGEEEKENVDGGEVVVAVSYTHLTLPTIYSV